ncbi:MAG: ATP-binding protein [Pseudomonadota bacterium]
MFWSRLSIGKKLFIAITATTAVIVISIALMTAANMSAGFSRYILEAELDRFDPVRIALVNRHDDANPGWPEIKGRHDALNRIVRRNLVRPGGPPRPGPGARQASDQRGADQSRPPPRQPDNRRRPRPPRDPMQLGSRVALLDAQGEFVAGARPDDQQTARRPIMREGEDRVLGYLSIAMPRRADQASGTPFLRDQLRVLGIISVFALILSGLAAFWLSRQFTRPVHTLMQGTVRLSKGEFDVKLTKTSQDEFGDLVDQFNKLASYLEAAEKAERQWMSDTSHELQTPISVLKAEIEAIQDGIRKPDEKTLATLHDSVNRLSLLVKDINQLSKAREGQLIENTSRESLTLLAQEAINRARTPIEQADLTLESSLHDDVLLRCNPLRIGQLLDNLLTNARRYTDAPGTVRLSLEKNEGGIRLSVEDSNGAPPPDMHEKLFDRFFRAEPSRARQHGGSGLGLPICRMIVEAHGGTIRAEPSPMGGLAIRVHFPMQP